MNTRKMEVAVFGALNIDILGTANIAGPRTSSLPGEIRTALGGTGWSAARACSLLGLNTAFFSVLAADGYEAGIRALAQSEGVDISACRWDEGQNGCCLTIRDAEGRRLASVNDMNFSRRMDALFCADAARKADGAAAAVADCDLQAAALGKLCEKLDGVLPLVVNSVSASKCMRAQALLPRIHTLLSAEEAAARLAGYAGAERCATALLKQGLQRVCILTETDGILLADREQMRRLPASGLTEADAALTAALAVSLARGTDFDACARLLTAAAAVAARSREAVNPELARLKPFLEPTGGKAHAR